MGCFSFICQVCNDPVKSNSSSGEEVRLFLLRKGKIIENMEGQYDSYGRVFDADMESIKWEMPWPEVCGLMSSKNTRDNGMAVIHKSCSETLIPTERSDNDPNQGGGEYRH